MRKIALLLVMTLCTSIASQAEVLKITPQFVVERVLSQGRDAKNIEFEALKAYYPLSLVLSIYDLKFDGSVSYEMSRARVIGGGGNDQDKTTIWTTLLSKKTSTGTTFSLGYDRTLQNSIFRTGSTSTRTPYAVLDEAEFTIKQDLMGNFFGIVDRRAEEVARQNIYVASLQKKENQEQLVVTALQLFWDTYVAKETLRENINARNKYEEVVKSIEEKTRTGFSDPGDLPRARAEYETQKKNVKEASFQYISLMDRLFTMMLLPPRDEIVFDVPVEVPPLPPLTKKEISSLRSVRAAEISATNAELEKRAADLGALPSLSVFGRANYTGLESLASRSFADVTANRYPEYEVGLNLSYNFFSEGTKGNQQLKGVLYEQSLNNLAKTKETEDNHLLETLEKVKARYAVAVSAIESVKFWEQAVKAQERSFKQGRVELSTLFTDYRSYYEAQSVRTKAIGDYHISVNELAAARDVLIE